MRSILTILFSLCFFAFINAQTITPAFITDSEIEWLENELVTLNTAYLNMKDAIKSGDNTEIAANKRALMKSVNRVATNCKTTVGKIEWALDPETQKRRETPDTPNYRYNKQKQNDKLEEVRVSNENLAVLKANTDKMVELRDAMKSTRYSFGNNTEKSKQNIAYVNDILTLAKNTNSIIKASIAE